MEKPKRPRGRPRKQPPSPQLLPPSLPPPPAPQLQQPPQDQQLTDLERQLREQESENPSAGSEQRVAEFDQATAALPSTVVDASPAGAPGAAATVATPTKPTLVRAEFVSLVLDFGFNTMAKRMGDHWRLDDYELLAGTQAVTPLLDLIVQKIREKLPTAMQSIIPHEVSECAVVMGMIVGQRVPQVRKLLAAAGVETPTPGQDTPASLANPVTEKHV